MSVGMLAKKVGLSYQLADQETIDNFVADYSLGPDDYSYLGGNPWSEVGTVPLDSRLGVSPNTSLYGSVNYNTSSLSMETLSFFIEQNWSAFAFQQKTIDGQVCYIYRLYANGTAYYPIIARDGLGPTIFDTNSFSYLYKSGDIRPDTLSAERDLFTEIAYGNKRLVNLHNNT